MNNKKVKTRHNYLIGVILDNTCSGQLLRGRIYIGFVQVSPTFEKSNSRLSHKCQTIDWLSVYTVIKTVFKYIIKL